MKTSEQLAVYTEEVQKVVDKYLPKEEGYQKVIFEAMNYSVGAGGKRLRPLLMREMYRLFGGKGREIEPFMAAIEMIHTSSLIHDDLPCMDNDERRRGMQTTWVKYGYAMAVLAGDGLMMYGIETAAKAYKITKQPEKVSQCIQILAEKTGIYGMIGGQTVDVQLTGKKISRGRLDFICRLKTGALLEAAMMIGALLGGASKIQLAIVEATAATIGMAFQIRDDILDATGDEGAIGKPVGSDARKKKTTYITLEGVEKAREDVIQLSKQSIDGLRSLPNHSEFLEELIEYLITREQ